MPPSATEGRTSTPLDIHVRCGKQRETAGDTRARPARPGNAPAADYPREAPEAGGYRGPPADVRASRNRTLFPLQRALPGRSLPARLPAQPTGKDAFLEPPAGRRRHRACLYRQHRPDPRLGIEALRRQAAGPTIAWRGRLAGEVVLRSEVIC